MFVGQYAMTKSQVSTIRRSIWRVSKNLPEMRARPCALRTSREGPRLADLDGLYPLASVCCARLLAAASAREYLAEHVDVRFGSIAVVEGCSRTISRSMLAPYARAATLQEVSVRRSRR